MEKLRNRGQTDTLHCLLFLRSDIGVLWKVEKNNRDQKHHHALLMHTPSCMRSERSFMETQQKREKTRAALLLFLKSHEGGNLRPKRLDTCGDVVLEIS
jgi:hypothetical protein